LHIHVERANALGPSEYHAWRGTTQCARDLNDPFLTPEFAQLVAAARPRARVAVLEQDGLIGFFAFELGPSGLARPIGHGLSDYQAVIAPDALLDGAELLRACRRPVLRFDHFDERQAALLGARYVKRCASPFIDLQHGWAHYVAERRRASQTLFATAERKARKLGREVGSLCFEPDCHDHAVLERVIRWKREQYRRTRVPDVLARDETRELLHQILDAGEPEFSGVLSTLRAGDQLVAAHFGVRSEVALRWWFPAYDATFAPYSPGVTLALRLAEWAAGRSIRRVELGKGDEQYKQRLGSGERIVADGWLAAPAVSMPFGVARSVRRGLQRAMRSVRQTVQPEEVAR
jgi:CelD/BcsL family acetyltransferase involved in cellulose biosynthesis